MFSSPDCLEPDLERAAGEVIDGEAIIINLATGVYYSMEGIGGEIWSMIEARHSAGSILEEILASYDVDPDAARRDLEAVLGQMLDDGLIRRIPGTGHNGQAVSRSRETKPYVQPRLQVYRDMEDLLALDPPAPGMKRIAWNDGSGQT